MICSPAASMANVMRSRTSKCRAALVSATKFSNDAALRQQFVHARSEGKSFPVLIVGRRSRSSPRPATQESVEIRDNVLGVELSNKCIKRTAELRPLAHDWRLIHQQEMMAHDRRVELVFGKVDVQRRLRARDQVDARCVWRCDRSSHQVMPCTESIQNCLSVRCFTASKEPVDVLALGRRVVRRRKQGIKANRKRQDRLVTQ